MEKREYINLEFKTDLNKGILVACAYKDDELGESDESLIGHISHSCKRKCFMSYGSSKLCMMMVLLHWDCNQDQTSAV